MRKPKPMTEYTPMTWDSESKLSKDEQETVESQRRQLWAKGVRTQPNLDRMAFEFAAIITMLRSASGTGL